MVLYNFLYLFLLFIIYSFLGWLIECTVVFFGTGKLVNRGFLMGPYCPVYGFGALIMLYIASEYGNNPVDLYIMCVIDASILEYFTSFLMEKLFNARWWDYSHSKFNINGRICLTNSILFGFSGLFLCYVFHPLVINVLGVIPEGIIYTVTSIILVLFVIDMCVTFKVITKLRKNFVAVNRDMTADINRQFTKFIESNHIFKAFPLLKEKISRFRFR